MTSAVPPTRAEAEVLEAVDGTWCGWHFEESGDYVPRPPTWHEDTLGLIRAGAELVDFQAGIEAAMGKTDWNTTRYPNQTKFQRWRYSVAVVKHRLLDRLAEVGAVHAKNAQSIETAAFDLFKDVS